MCKYLYEIKISLLSDEIKFRNKYKNKNSSKKFFLEEHIFSNANNNVFTRFFFFNLNELIKI